MAGSPSPSNVVGVAASPGGVEVLKSLSIRDRAGSLPAETAATGTLIERRKDIRRRRGLLEKLADRAFEETEMKPGAWMELDNHIAMARQFATDFDSVLGRRLAAVYGAQEDGRE